MKKQSGFTLIELMVVMAIIAILATAGLSAYTGYIKKARDATRIADLAALNTIVISAMSTTGTAPTLAQLQAAILAANNGQEIQDPLNWLSNCLPVLGDQVLWSGIECAYTYLPCDDGLGYVLAAQLESESNRSLNDDNLAGPGTSGNGTVGDEDWGFEPINWSYFSIDDTYDIGSCQNYVDLINGSAGANTSGRITPL